MALIGKFIEFRMNRLFSANTLHTLKRFTHNHIQTGIHIYTQSTTQTHTNNKLKIQKHKQSNLITDQSHKHFLHLNRMKRYK